MTRSVCAALAIVACVAAACGSRPEEAADTTTNPAQPPAGLASQSLEHGPGGPGPAAPGVAEAGLRRGGPAADGRRLLRSGGAVPAPRPGAGSGGRSLAVLPGARAHGQRAAGPRGRRVSTRAATAAKRPRHAGVAGQPASRPGPAGTGRAALHARDLNPAQARRGALWPRACGAGAARFRPGGGLPGADAGSRCPGFRGALPARAGVSRTRRHRQGGSAPAPARRGRGRPARPADGGAARRAARVPSPKRRAECGHSVPATFAPPQSTFARRSSRRPTTSAFGTSSARRCRSRARWAAPCRSSRKCCAASQTSPRPVTASVCCCIRLVACGRPPSTWPPPSSRNRTTWTRACGSVDALRELGQLQESLAQYRAALAIDPRVADARFGVRGDAGCPWTPARGARRLQRRGAPAPWRHPVRRGGSARGIRARGPPVAHRASVTRSVEFALSPAVTTCLRPDGQSTSTRSIFVGVAEPEVQRQDALRQVAGLAVVPLREHAAARRRRGPSAPSPLRFETVPASATRQPVDLAAAAPGR